VNKKHTPGPWNDGMDSKGNLIIMQRYGDPYLNPEDINEEWQSNLRLVSAAPELLAALEAARRLIELISPLEGAVTRQIDAAIAKATGGEE